MLEAMPEDLRRAYETFVLLCTHYKMSFAGMMMGAEPPNIYVLGNVKERGSDLVELFHTYANVIEAKFDRGLVQNSDTPITNLN